MTNEHPAQLCFHKEAAAASPERRPLTRPNPARKAAFPPPRLTCFQDARERDAEQQLLQHGPAQRGQTHQQPAQMLTKMLTQLLRRGVRGKRLETKGRTHQAAAVAHHPTFRRSAMVGWGRGGGGGGERRADSDQRRRRREHPECVYLPASAPISPFFFLLRGNQKRILLRRCSHKYVNKEPVRKQSSTRLGSKGRHAALIRASMRAPRLGRCWPRPPSLRLMAC